MSPRQLNPDSVRRRLAEVDRLLGWLQQLGTPTGDHLRESWRDRLMIERILEQLVEMAVAVNLHVARSAGVSAPEDYRGSFPAAAQVGAITVELADRLASSAGLRNVVVHDYLGVDLDIIAGAVPAALADFEEYRRQVARWLLAADDA